MGAVTSAVIAIAAVVLGWITIEIACKPCLDRGREAVDRSLNPDYDPDDDVVVSTNIRAPLIPDLQQQQPQQPPQESNPRSYVAPGASSTAATKVV